jgi:hypothetical protein
MSIIQAFDVRKFQYTLEYYLHEQELDYSVLEHLNNNNINLGSLICFFDIIKSDTHFIVASSNTNLHNIITISKCECEVNSISVDNSIIQYNNFKFTI